MVPGALRRLGRKLNAETGRHAVQSLQRQCRAFSALPQEAYESEEKIRVTVPTFALILDLAHACIGSSAYGNMMFRCQCR